MGTQTEGTTKEKHRKQKTHQARLRSTAPDQNQQKGLRKTNGSHVWTSIQNQSGTGQLETPT